jgi:hypothetical protein
MAIPEVDVADVDYAVIVDDHATAYERDLVQKEDVRRTTGIVVVDDRTGSRAADIAADGTVTYSMAGNSPQGEEGNLDVAWALIQRLNRDGANWGDLVDKSGARGRDETGIDVRARDGTLTLNIQVTRAVYDDDDFRRLNASGQVGGSAENAEALAERLWLAIEKKAQTIRTSTQRTEMTIAINTRDTPAFTLSGVASVFRSRYGQMAHDLGFAGIWLASEFPDLTTRLDLPPTAYGD